MSPSSIYLSGAANPQTQVVITISAIGNPAVALSVDNVLLSGNSFTSPQLMESKTFAISATNGIGSGDATSVPVSVIIDPVFAKLCGTSGKSYRYSLRTKQEVSDVNPVSILSPCELDDKFTFLPNSRLLIDLGTNPSCGVLSGVSGFTFNPSTMALFFGEPKTINAATFTTTSFECTWTKPHLTTGLPVNFREVYVLY